MTLNIDKIVAYRVWDSRGFPTIEASIYANNGSVLGSSIAPSGASKGRYEAFEKRDVNPVIFNDVLDPINYINSTINKYFSNKKIINQEDFDNHIISLDDTNNKSNLGSNTTISLSMAFARAISNKNNEPLWKHYSTNRDLYLPLPEIQIFGGGAHANNSIDIQDFMIIPIGAKNYLNALEICSKVYHSAGKVLDIKNIRSGVADEGGYWPNFKSNEEGFDLLLQSIEMAGFIPNEDVGISVDVAASEFYINSKYNLKKDNLILNSDDYFELILNWINKYNIISIEDPFDESEKNLFAKLNKLVGDKVQIVGDDLLVTNTNFINNAKELNLCNAVLIKPNQVGTLTETLNAVNAAKFNNIDQIISARSGETEDTTIMHLAVAWGINQIKVGSFARSERMIKWNEGIRIGNAMSHHNFENINLLPWNK